MNKILMFLLLFGLTGCNTEGNKAVDREKIKQEMSDRQIKRVSEPALMEAAFQTGEKLVSAAEGVLLEKLKNFSENNQLDSVVDQVGHQDYEKLIAALIDSLNHEAGHRISLIGLGLEKIHPDTSVIEKQLLDAYQYNVEHDIPLEDNIQKSGTGYLLFTRAITSEMNICSLILAKNISSDDPDKLSGQQVGFCGIWSIKLSKKDIIKSL
ncbi:hypothetical protein QQ020_12410 [Fulvivirgaceae bacterium BMA12]|uniref:Lipoprotein n=1 Tax=Agaribacillus aureus TaxID=3051825 RepID=A0ABT8L528_9BACT|nr:hypothetical protein [Fulvivirgaceae bacterium BMA12]